MITLKRITTTLLMFLLFTAIQCKADCFDRAAKVHHVSVTILQAIALVESSGNAKAIGKNVNGTVDYGMMQINSSHLKELKRYGVTKQDLMNSCKNVMIGAWLL